MSDRLLESAADLREKVRHVRDSIDRLKSERVPGPHWTQFSLLVGDIEEGAHRAIATASSAIDRLDVLVLDTIKKPKP